eukprot:TRINITY_DN129_c0_g1_i1.p1 TRINITY_DN129_c0_g1~~TRINITY_DN129_c0_g1_i1.p1  ORF type:complete len:108 (-),score=31.00 TRINITY_DN129_c0_g1_i1:379-702(-)
MKDVEANKEEKVESVTTLLDKVKENKKASKYTYLACLLIIPALLLTVLYFSDLLKPVAPQTHLSAHSSGTLQGLGIQNSQPSPSATSSNSPEKNEAKKETEKRKKNR